MIKRFFTSVFVLIIFIAPSGQYANAISIATAQSSLDPWTTPVNLSKSGSTSEPSLVLDSNGFLHVFWYDSAAESFFYTRREGNEWTEPTKINVPFENEDPRLLLADPQGVIHAFWTNDDNDLSYAYISIASLTTNPTWLKVQPLGNGVQDFDAEIDTKGSLHVVYVRSDESSNLPAGIYHRSVGALGGKWTESKLLDGSRYFRSLDRTTANVDIAITKADENDYVYVAWDNRPLKQIYLIKSIDGGNQWQEVKVIDGPTEISPLEDPFNLSVHAYGKNVLLIWEAGLQSGFDCTQYSQFSSDLGETWLERQLMYKNLVGCPQENRIFNLDEGLVIMSTIQDQPYLTAWNGEEWSEPQPQSVLSSFSNAETFKTILFRCHQTAYSGPQLFVAGCDTGGEGDIWVTSRTLGTLSDWFGPPAGWTKPVAITDSQQNITSPVIICTPEGNKHAFWSQTLEKGASNLDTAIFYAKLDENGWTQPTRVLNTPDARAVQPVVTFDNQGHLIAAWSSSVDLGVFSSIASAGQTQNAFDWSKPFQLPSVSPIAGSPDVLVDQNGDILVVYVIRVNEGRGIYLTRSSDEGKTWLEPMRIFDAVASKWTMVDQPKLAQTSDGTLHLIWTQNSVTGGATASALYYAQSKDDGQTWSPLQLVIEEPLSLVNIFSTRDRMIDIFWLSHGRVPGIYHQFSINGGETWSTPENISAAGDVPTSMGVIPDHEGGLHIFQAIEEQARRFSINYLVWNGARWTAQDRIYLGDEFPGQIDAINMCLDSKDQLAAVFTLLQQDISSGDISQGLYFTSHSLQKEAFEAPGSAQLVLPTQALTATLVSEVPAISLTQTPGVTPTITSSTPTIVPISGESRQIPTNTGAFDQPWVGLALGLGLSFIIVLAVFGLILRRRRQRDYR